MMSETFDFDRLINRRGTFSYKWDSDADPDMLPMWVADMDFETAPAVLEAVRHRAAHGIYGYTRVPDAFYESLIGWFARRHKFRFTREDILYTTGVVPALSCTIKALTTPGDKVVILTPVYNLFFTSIRNNGCLASESPLVVKDGRYTIDFADLEKKLSDPAARVMLMCNPHNPGGRVWTPEELARVGELARRHGVTVISDEIHGEFVFKGRRYTPFAAAPGNSLRESVMLTSTSKSFNTAGLQIAAIITADPALRAKIERAVNVNEVCDVNPFGPAAAVAAYNKGEAWLDALIAYIEENDRTLRAFFAGHLPDFPVMPLEGTYLEWVDISALGADSRTVQASLKEHEKVWLNAGMNYGEDAGRHYLRINIACPRSRLTEGLKRIEAGLKRLKTA